MNSISNIAEQFFSSPTATISFQIILIIYIAIVAPMSADYITSIMDNYIAKIIFVLLILGATVYSMPIALLLSIAFIVTLQSINLYKVMKSRDGFRNKENQSVDRIV